MKKRKSNAHFGMTNVQWLFFLLFILIVEYLQTTHLKVAVVVKSANGEIFTNEQRVANDIEQGFVFDDKDPSTNVGWFIAGFIGIVIVSVVLFVYVFRKAKKTKKE